MCCHVYLTLDQQVVFSVARITGVANLLLSLTGLLDQELNPGPGGMKLMLYH